MMKNNNILIDGTSQCLVVGSLTTNKRKEYVNSYVVSYVVIILPMALYYIL